jgi:hypothetical protein
MRLGRANSLLEASAEVNATNRKGKRIRFSLFKPYRLGELLIHDDIVSLFSVLQVISSERLSWSREPDNGLEGEGNLSSSLTHTVFTDCEKRE